MVLGFAGNAVARGCDAVLLVLLGPFLLRQAKALGHVRPAAFVRSADLLGLGSRRGLWGRRGRNGGGRLSGSKQYSNEQRHRKTPKAQIVACCEVRLPFGQSLGRRGPTSARMMPRTALTSRDDQPVLVKIVRSVFRVAWVRDGGWKYPLASSS